MNMELFMEIHSGMPRQGPGSNASTRRAFELIADIPQGVRVLDIGCGPGQQTLELARLVQPFGGSVTAVDLYRQYLEQLCCSADKAGIKNITVVNADMCSLPFDDASFDLLWSEGAIYIIGFEKGLTEWKRLLKPGGVLAITELSWLNENVPDDVRAFWAEGYPAMQTVAANLAIARRCGYRIPGHFILPEHAWFDDYYNPLEARIAMLKKKYAGDSEATALLETETKEMKLYRNHSDCYGYGFFILQQ